MSSKRQTRLSKTKIQYESKNYKQNRFLEQQCAKKKVTKTKKILSNADKQERLIKNREAAHRYRAKIYQDPDSVESYREKARVRYHKNQKDKVKLSERGQRSRRKYERVRKQVYRANEKKKAASNSNHCDSPSTSSAQQHSRPEISWQAVAGRRRSAKMQRKCYRDIDKLKVKNENLVTRLNKTKKRLSRAKAKLAKATQGSDSIQLSVDQLLSNIDSNKPIIRKKLITGEVLQQQLKTTYRNTTNVQQKRFISSILVGKIVKKYKLLSTFGKSITAAVKKKQSVIKMRATSEHIKSTVIKFYLENSIINPSKSQCSKDGDSNYIPKRYLNATKIDLFHKFCQEEDAPISCTTFKKYCPSYCVAPKINERETCACPIHVNFFFLVDALHNTRILSESTTHQFVQSLTCLKITEMCLNRTCLNCKDKEPVFKNIDDMSKKITYKKWVTKTENRVSAVSGKSIKVTFISQIKCTLTISEVVECLKSEVPGFLEHNFRILHQFNAKKGLKEEIKTSGGQGIFHWDFSENYSCKYTTEVQSMHYGAARQQVTLHTGYFYSKEKNQGYATLSKDLNHKSVAVTAHIQKILDIYSSSLENIDTVHFFSDSPSSQYRNQSIFYLFTQFLMEKFPRIQNFTHNYSEKNHGKDEGDGIGAVLKRIGDNAVRHNTDVPDFETFFSVLQSKIKNVEVSSITSEDIQKISNVLEENSKFVKPFKGTMNVHQFTWTRNNPRMIYFNSLSCFNCPPGTECKHYHLGVIDYNTPSKQKQNAQFKNPDNKAPISVPKSLKKNVGKNMKKEHGNSIINSTTSTRRSSRKSKTIAYEDFDYS